jgi:hypothetical protein
MALDHLLGADGGTAQTTGTTIGKHPVHYSRYIAFPAL